MIIGLAGALAAAICYGFGSVLQAMAAEGSTVTERLDVVLLARLVAQWRYIAGLALDLLGFVAALVALRTLPLFVVQAAVASSIGVTALAAVKILHARISPLERRALGGLVLGLLCLAVAGRPERATALHEPGPALLLGLAVLLAAAALLFTRSTGERTAAALAAGAGAGFGAVGIAARALEFPAHWVHLLADPLFYAILAHGALATLLFAAALQRGKVTTVAGVNFAVETVFPAVVGVIWLGDRARPGTAPVAAIGFVVTLVSAIALARFAEPAAATVGSERPTPR